MYGTEELRPFIRKYYEKITELKRCFVSKCAEENIEYNSTFGFFLEMVMGELYMGYCHKCLDDMRKR